MSALNSVKRLVVSIGAKNGHAFPQTSFERQDGVSNEEAHKQYNTEHVIWRFGMLRHAKSLIENEIKELTNTSFGHCGLPVAEEIRKKGKGSHCIYDGSVVSLNAKVKSPSKRLNKDKLSSSLRKQGVSAEVINKAFAEAETETAAPVEFEVVQK